jgi:excisionase family DNA binding protein
VSHCLAVARDGAGVVAGTILADGGEVRMNQLLLTINECCRMASIGRTKFYELVASGEIPVRKIGKKTLVAVADLERWVERLPTIEAKATGQSREKASHRELVR